MICSMKGVVDKHSCVHDQTVRRDCGEGKVEVEIAANVVRLKE